jgi:hypothetical protein
MISPPLLPPPPPQSCHLKYELPGCSGTLVDLVNDGDVGEMWDELGSAALGLPLAQQRYYPGG